MKKLAQSLNSPRVCLIPAPEKKEMFWASIFALVNAQEAQKDPARPFTNVLLPGLVSDTVFAEKDRRNLLESGVSTWRKSGQSIVMERLVSTYTKSLSGALDPSLRDLNTIQTLSYMRFFFRQALLLSFPRHKLAKDDYPYPGDVLTPKALKVWLLSKYRQLQDKGFVQDPDGGFSKKLTVKVDPNKPGSVLIGMEPYIMGSFIKRRSKWRLRFRNG